MKNLVKVLFSLLILFSCSTSENGEALNREKELPSEILKVFQAHGGLANWDEMQTLSFTIPKGDIEEIHTIDLHSRMDRVETPAYDIGFDGDSAWVKEKTGEYKDDPLFRHNLMFYFYAMPFVLADEGINYDVAEPLVYEGKSYPGVKITYSAGVGDAPDDIYLLHYDSETYQMAWLGYKATFGKELKEGPPSWIKYDEWAEVNGVNIPTSIAWQKVEDGEIVAERNRVNFTDISLSKENKPASFYTKDGAID
jgi:hypothetical protein